MKTKRLTFFLLTFIFSIAFINAAIIKESRTVGSFSKIQASSGIDVHFVQTGSYKVEIEADKEDMKYIISKTEGDKLILKWEGDMNRRQKHMSIDVYVSAPSLYEITLSGGSDFSAERIKSDKNFKISISGGADVEIESLKVAKNTTINSSGGSDCEIKYLETGSCDVSASGGSDISIDIKAKGDVNITASGGSDIELSGSVDNISVSASGASDIDIENLSYKGIHSKKANNSNVSR